MNLTVVIAIVSLCCMPFNDPANWRAVFCRVHVEHLVYAQHGHELMGLKSPVGVTGTEKRGGEGSPLFAVRVDGLVMH